ncbi:MAG TPA: DUF4097 family beta strand repeat-containing protein [Phycisphaerae bacterium]|nr:DUF4097 family beta strand repeat-containing protein [Phycisphaerae bacterium]
MQVRQFAKVAVFCAVFGAFIFGCNQMRAKVWVEQIDELTFDADGLNKIAVTTHNGPITFNGDADRDDVQVVVTRKGGGKNTESANAALAAIEIVSEATDDGTHNLGYRWSTQKHVDWQANVAFEVSMPAHLMARARSHNGPIAAKQIEAACDFATHNGRISVDAPVASISAETHNGAIDAACSGQSVHLASHNGPIKLIAHSPANLNGSATTHNGSINVTVPKSTNTRLSCRTGNGSIHCDVPWAETKRSRRSATGVLGDGSGEFKVETHNGSIRVQEAEE